MTIYLKTTFDDSTRKFRIEKMTFRYGNDSEINQVDYKPFKNIDKFGIVDIKIHPLEASRWYNSLPQKVKDENNILFWDGGWISLPWETIKVLSLE